MSGTRPDLEERLRRVLEQTARQLDAPPAHWQGPTPPRRRRLRGLGNAAALAGTLVAVLIVVIVLATAGQRHAAPAGAGSLAAIAPPAAALEPRLSAAEKNYVG